MANQILIRFHTLRPGVDPDMVSWVVFDDNRQAQQIQQGSLDEVSAHIAGNKVIVVVPGDDVLLNKVVLPTQNRKKMVAALPFALEDQLVTDVEQLHFAIGERNERGEVACAIVAHKKMQAWINKLNQFGIHPHVMLPDILALPYIEGAWSLLIEDNDVIIRTGNQSGMSVDEDQAIDYLHMLLDEHADERPEQLMVYKTDAMADATTSLSVFDLPVTEDNISDGVLTFVHGLVVNNTINLLQGEYSRREQMGKIWRPWLPAAAMFGALVMLQLVMTTTQYFQLNSQSKSLRAEIEQTYRTAFPQARNIVNPRVQMERKLKKLRGGSGLDSDSVLGLLQGSAPVLKKTSGLTIKSVRYKEGKLDIDLVINDLQSLDKLKQQLITQGQVSVDIVSANSRDNKVESRLKISGAS